MKINRALIFLACYEQTGSIAKAAEAARIAPSTHHKELKKSEAYRAAFEKAQAVAVDNLKAQALERIEKLEDAVFERAVAGWIEPVVYQGKFTYEKQRNAKGKFERGQPLGIRKFSDSDAQFLLRGLKPEVYRERVQLSGSVQVSGTLSIADVLRQRRAKKTKPESE